MPVILEVVQKLRQDMLVFCDWPPSLWHRHVLSKVWTFSNEEHGHVIVGCGDLRVRCAVPTLAYRAHVYSFPQWANAQTASAESLAIPAAFDLQLGTPDAEIPVALLLTALNGALVTFPTARPSTGLDGDLLRGFHEL